jgi:hypothetical protein
MSHTIDLDFSHQSIVDAEHLKLLSIGYMISAGFNALFLLFGLFYVFMGVMVSEMIRLAPEVNTKPNQPPPALIGWIFAGIGMVFVTFALTFAILKFCAASKLKHRTSRIFCMVVAGLTCLEFPYGTALGAMTFMVLNRDSIVRLFETNAAPQPLAPQPAP